MVMYPAGKGIHSHPGSSPGQALASPIEGEELNQPAFKEKNSL